MENYLEINKALWNQRAEIHYKSEFYNNDAFIKGKCSLKSIELAILGDLAEKKVAHLQCHFGQDSISLSRRGARVTALDLSDNAINKAQQLAEACGEKVQFVCGDVYNADLLINDTFDVVFTSYGTIGWLPDLDKWATVIANLLNPGGKLIFVEFHPVMWMFDDEFEKIKYSYFNLESIIESSEGTYTDNVENCSVTSKSVSWNHSLSDVFKALIANGLIIQDFAEYNYSPYSCFNNVTKLEDDKYQIAGLTNKLPMVYSVVACKNSIK